MLFKKKKTTNVFVENKTEKNIKKMLETIDYLKSINRYFSKPYSLKEVREILSRSKTVNVLCSFDDKMLIIEHFFNYSSLIKLDYYYFQGKEFDSLDEIFNDNKVLGFALKDNWDKIKVLIMLDEEYHQVF